MPDVEALEDFKGIGEVLAERLREAGIERPGDVADASVGTLAEIEGISESMARELKAEAGVETRARARTPREHLDPGNWEVTDTQARHLERMGVGDAASMVGEFAANLREQFDLPPEFVNPFVEKVCGKVVARDPASGDLQPVPNATVTVYDTDASFLGYFPPTTPYCWLWPYWYSRERIGRTRTDECGEFCVYVPRWELDRILRHRRERVCLPDLVRPDLEDLLVDPRVLPEPVRPPWPEPRPQPDPRPRFELADPGQFERIAGLVGEDIAGQLDRDPGELTIGDSLAPVNDLLNRPAFTTPIPAPLPEELRTLDEWAELGSELPAIDVEPDVLERIDPRDELGPFLRCRDVFVPEWKTIVDVPDITFEVTQDVDGDGSAEVIYSEGYFEVRWDDIPDEVQLLADENAISVPSCRRPPPETILPCEEPAIVSVEDMALRTPYYDPDPTSASAGYMRKINRPLTSSSTTWSGGEPASGNQAAVGEAPFAGTLQLHGCARVGDATHYRIVYRYEDGSPQPMTGHEWSVPVLIDEGPYPVRPVNAEGWYKNITVTDLESHYGVTFDSSVDEASDVLTLPYLLMQWPTGAYSNGRYDLRVEIGDAAGNVTYRSDWLPFVVDNRPPLPVSINAIEWWVKGAPSTGDTFSADDSCPTIRRPNEDILVKVTYEVSATHLRDLRMRLLGCDGQMPIEEPKKADRQTTDDTVYRYWHTDVNDNHKAGTVTFEIGKDDPEGTYTVALDAWTRAYNPALGQRDPSWTFNRAVRDRHPRQGIAVVNR